MNQAPSFAKQTTPEPPAPVFHPVSNLPGAPQPSEGSYELKFQLPQPTVEAVMDWARVRIPADPHAGSDGTYRIHSLYLDTAERDVYHRSRGYKDSKYRVRRYGSGSLVYLERKLKRRGWVRKQRTAIPEAQLARLHETELDDAWPGFWFHDRMQELGLAPCLQVAYQRFACVGEAEGSPIRLTLDRELRCVPTTGLSLEADWESSHPVEGTILELKFRRSLPRVFKELVRDFALQPTAASKYRRSMELCGLVGS